jgi:hypothetical protein
LISRVGEFAARPGHGADELVEIVRFHRAAADGPGRIRYGGMSEYAAKHVAAFGGRAAGRFAGVVPSAALPRRDQVVTAILDQAWRGDRPRLEGGDRR